MPFNNEKTLPFSDIQIEKWLKMTLEHFYSNSTKTISIEKYLTYVILFYSRTQEQQNWKHIKKDGTLITVEIN